MEILSVQNVYKAFKQQEVLKGACLSIEHGEIVGLFGDNGSGKSVLIKCICGLCTVDKGKIRMMGEDVKAGNTLDNPPGLLLEHPGFIESFTAFENLKFLADIKSKTKDDDIKFLLSQMGLNPEDKKPVRNYSLGMRQRVAIAQAFLDDPAFIILDEAFNGLDADTRQKLQKILVEKKKTGTAIMLVSHHRDDIESIADKTFMLKEGKIKQEEKQL